MSLRAGSIYDATIVQEAIAGAGDIVISVPAFPDESPELRDAVASVREFATLSGARVGVVGGAGTLHSVDDGREF